MKISCDIVHKVCDGIFQIHIPNNDSLFPQKSKIFLERFLIDKRANAYSKEAQDND